MTQSQLLEFLSECAKRGIVVTLNLAMSVEPDRKAAPLDDDSPVAQPEVPDLLSYYYGKR